MKHINRTLMLDQLIEKVLLVAAEDRLAARVIFRATVFLLLQLERAGRFQLALHCRFILEASGDSLGVRNEIFELLVVLLGGFLQVEEVSL